MGTVYSLICFGGKDGKTVTFTDAGDVVNLTSHGLRNGTGVVFTDNAGNTLPTGLTKGTTYYAKQGADANKFTLWTTSALSTQVTFSGTGSGTHKVKSAYFSGLTVDQLARYGTSGSERIYDGLVAWRTARYSAAGAYDTEYCEIGMAWDDITAAALAINIPAAETIIWPKVNGVYTDAWHGGVVGAGYRFWPAAGYAKGLDVTGVRQKLFDFSIHTTANNIEQLFILGTFNLAHGLIITGTANNIGLALQSSSSQVFNCIATGGLGTGFKFLGYSNAACIIANNLAVKCVTGFLGSSSSCQGFYYNNMSVGNTTNWGTAPTLAGGAVCAYNGGISTDTPWYTTTDTGIKTLTANDTTFVSYSGNDFRPASSSAGQVDTGIAVIGMEDSDLKWELRPNYNNGGSEAWDIGPFEYDHGYGLPPASGTLSGSGIVAGSRVKIAKQSDGTEIVNAVVAGTTKSDAYTGPNQDVYVYVRKGSAAPYYHPVRLSGAIADGNLSYDLSGLQSEDIAAHDYSATAVATDWAFNLSTGAITHDSGTTRYSVQDLYSWHQDYTDDSATVDDLPLMHGTTPTIFELLNSGSITDSDLEDLFGGSIEFGDGTLWSNLYHAGSLTGTPDIYVVQGTGKLTSYWTAGTLDILVKVSNAGTLISSGIVDVYARKWGYTFDNYRVDLSGGGRNVAPLGTLADANNTTARATVSAYSLSAPTFSTYSLDFSDGDGAQTYYARFDCNNLPLSECYEFSKYLTDESSTATLNGVEGWRYQSAHSSMTPVKSSPFGTFAGGVWAVAPGVWLDNVPTADRTNYILTDASGGTHQNTVTPGAIVATVLADTRVRVYNVTQATEIDNVTVTGTSYEYVISTEADQNDVIDFFACKLGYEPFRARGQFDTVSGLAVLVDQVVDAVYTAWGIDGSTITEFTGDVTGHIYIDANDLDGATTKTRLGAWYSWVLTTEIGIRHFFGGVTYLSTAAIRINTDVADILIENTNASTALRFTDMDVRLYRSDGTSIIAPTSYSIHNDYSGVPDVVETGVSGLTGSESAQLMSLTNAPSASTVADAVWSKALP